MLILLQGKVPSVWHVAPDNRAKLKTSANTAWPRSHSHTHTAFFCWQRFKRKTFYYYNNYLCASRVCFLLLQWSGAPTGWHTYIPNLAQSGVEVTMENDEFCFFQNSNNWGIIGHSVLRHFGFLKQSKPFLLFKASWQIEMLLPLGRVGSVERPVAQPCDRCTAMWSVIALRH